MRPGPLVAGEVTDKKSEPPYFMSGSFLTALRGKALSALAAVLAVALLLRVAAALVLQWFVQKSGHGRLCVFPDTDYYWLLAQAIRQGRPYEIVEYGTQSYKAMRHAGVSALSGGMPDGAGRVAAGRTTCAGLARNGERGDCLPADAAA